MVAQKIDKAPMRLLTPSDGLRIALGKRTERITVFFPRELMVMFDAWVERHEHADRTSAVLALVLDAIQKDQQQP